MRALVAVLCVLLPLTGLAQEAPPSPPPDAPVAAPPLVAAPEEEAEAEAAPFVPGHEEVTAAREASGPHPAARVLVETLAGGAGSLTVALVGGIVGAATSDCAIVEGDCGAAAIFALSGLAVGAAAGTAIAGRLMKGRGGFFGALLGSTLGTGAGLLVLIADVSRGDGGLGLAALLMLPTAGALVGYEASGAFSGSISAGFADPTRFSLTVTKEEESPVTPVIGPTPRGGLMGGLMGRF